MSKKIIQGGSCDWDGVIDHIPAEDCDSFAGLLSLVPGAKLADHHQGPLTFELLDELLEDLPRREAAQQAAHMEFILNQSRWQHLIMGELDKGGGLDATTRQMIHNMKFGVPCPISYPYVVIDEAKLPRFSRLRKFLFRKTIK